MNNENQEAQVRQQASHDEISRRAEELWRQYGSPQGRDEEIWFEAERQLRGSGLADAPASREKSGTTRTNAPRSTTATAQTPPSTPREMELMSRGSSTSTNRARSGKSGGK